MSENEWQYGIKPVGQGSWGGYGTSFPAGHTGREGIPIAGPGKDPFAEGRNIQQSEGYEIDMELLKQVLWEDRFLFSAATIGAILTYLVIRDPQKYAQLIQALLMASAETVKGIGEVIPG